VLEVPQESSDSELVKSDLAFVLSLIASYLIFILFGSILIKAISFGSIVIITIFSSLIFYSIEFSALHL
jgi:hypothetical protein